MYSMSPTNHRGSLDISPPMYGMNDARSTIPASDRSASNQSISLLLKHLPSAMTTEALVSMLLFAEDLLDARFIFDQSEDSGFQSALARFKTLDGANEAKRKLNGKPNSTNDAIMAVELLNNNEEGDTTASAGRKFSDAPPNRQMSASSSGSSSTNKLSRYNSTFQSMDKISPTKLSSSAEHPDEEGDQKLQTYYSSQSSNNAFNDRAWSSGKSMINDNLVDDETGKLLKDPLGYAKNGSSGSYPRHSSTSHIPISRFANLKLNTVDDSELDNAHRAPTNGFAYGSRSAQQVASPTSLDFPNMAMSPTSYSQLSPHFQRSHYPAANPADQNPPCNTLYVGNLPIDTSEDELKAIFSKQRGYKRLCFRTKHNGPMCFVEFEDVTFATKALNELYGHPLHNSIKGGIRLSFSKNPLGVRTGQGNGYGPGSSLTSPTGGAFGAFGAPPGFGAASGPPPGLGAPPGLSPSAIGGGGNGYAGAGAGFCGPSSPTVFAPHSYGRHQSFGGGGQMGGRYRQGSNAGSGMTDYLLGR